VGSTFGSTGDSSDSQALLIAGIIMGQIVFVTIVFALLMKYGKIKAIMN
jgi:hypothetical protein